jgi:hypothetical protein
LIPLDALVVTLAIEVPIVAWLYPGERARMAIACAVATAATNLFMNLVLVRLVSSYVAYLAIGESSALVVEAAVYAIVSRARDVPRAIVASGAANLASFAAGMLLFP